MSASVKPPSFIAAPLAAVVTSLGEAVASLAAVVTAVSSTAHPDKLAFLHF